MTWKGCPNFLKVGNFSLCVCYHERSCLYIVRQIVEMRPPYERTKHRSIYTAPIGSGAVEGYVADTSTCQERENRAILPP